MKTRNLETDGDRPKTFHPKIYSLINYSTCEKDHEGLRNQLSQKDDNSDYTKKGGENDLVSR